MRLGRHKNTEIEDIEAMEQETVEAVDDEHNFVAKHGAAETSEGDDIAAKHHGAADTDASEGEKDEEIDLRKLKKKDLLEIMLRQGEEIDRLRAQVADLEAQLNDYNFTIDKIGSIAEASLAVTNIFEEAEKAAKIYLMNIRSKVK